MKYDKISVVVPVYNAEPYLKHCIESICNSSYRNLEIILVDDGSTDGSGEICDQYARIDDRVRVIHKENGGPSSARNAGLNVATGEYIGFVDSDDVVDPKMYETLYADMRENHAQISSCGCKLMYKDRTVPNRETGELSVLYGQEALKALLSEKQIASSVSNKLYEKELFSDIRFDETISYGEDRLTNYYLIKAADRIVIRDRCLYTYRKRKGSATTQPFSAKQFSRIEAAKRIKADVEENMPQLRSYGINQLVKAMLSTYNRSWPYSEFKPERKEICKELEEIWKSDGRNIDASLKAALILTKIHPFAYSLSLRMYKLVCLGKRILG